MKNTTHHPYVAVALVFLGVLGCQSSFDVGTMNPPGGPDAGWSGGRDGQPGTGGNVGSGGMPGTGGVLGTGGALGVGGLTGTGGASGATTPDASRFEDTGRPDTTIVERDAGPDVPDLDRDLAGPDTPVIDRDTSPDGSTVERETATDGVRSDAAVDGGGPLLCTGRFTLGGFLPMGKTGSTPCSVALGDLNGDGRLDLVTANISPATVSVLLGKGDGTFAARVDYSVGTPSSWSPAPWRPSMLAVGDVNGDGKLDIAAAQDSGNSAPNLLVVLLGKGDGTFPTRATYAAEAGLSSVTLGDLNGDGKTDLVTASYGWNTVNTWVGSGEGDGARCDTGGGPRTVVLGDVNGDGKLDFVTLNTQASSVSVLPGRGDGTCGTRLDIPVGRGSQSLSGSAALGDVNGDGKLDLVVTTTSPGTVTVLLGKGDGSFAESLGYPTGDGPVLVALRDLDGDRNLDVLVASSAAGTVSVLRGQGDGTFAAKVDYPGVQTLRSAALGDLDGDGNLDLAMAGPVTNSADSGWTSVLFGTGPGTFIGRPAYPAGADLSAMALADLNDDGKLDIAAVGSQGDAAGTASVLLGAGDGTFAAKTDFATGDHPSSLALADVDDDGQLDLVTANQEAATVSVLPGAGDGTFAAKTDYATAETPSSVALADVNGDGKLDIAVAGYHDPSNPASSQEARASVLLGAGGGKFAAHVDYAVVGGPALTPQSLALGDVNGDGKVDIAVAADWEYRGSREGGYVDLLRGKGDGTFEDYESLWYFPAMNSVALVDLNGDGKLDVVAAAADGNDRQGRVAVLLGRGDGAFDPPPPKWYPTGLGARSFALGDLNQDGKVDVVTGNLEQDREDVPATVSVLLGNGDGTFAPSLDYPAAAVSLALGDVNGDGRPEIVTATPSRSLEVLSGACQ